MGGELRAGSEDGSRGRSARGPSRALPRSALRAATAFALGSGEIEDCLTDTAVDRLFERAWRDGWGTLQPRHRRGALLGVMGHVAESVTESVLVGLGYAPVWHFDGPGRHGVDLLVLSPAEQVVAVEVKSTLRAGVIPRLKMRELTQMSAAWLDRSDNPGMTEWGLVADDVYGLVVAVNFAERTIRYAATHDFTTLHPITAASELTDLHRTATAWAARPGATEARSAGE